MDRVVKGHHSYIHMPQPMRTYTDLSRVPFMEEGDRV